MSTPQPRAGPPQQNRPASPPSPSLAAKPAAAVAPPPPKERILVTGAAGFIASHLIPRLLAAGHPVSGIVRYERRASDNSKRRMPALTALQSRFKDRLQIIQCDDGMVMREAVARAKPEICIHLAGRSWVRESIAWPELYVEANYRTTVGLVDALWHAGCRRVVLASTVMVYGKDAPLPYMEDCLGSAPSSPYGASKLACEVLANTYHALHKMETVSLRLFSVYGPDLRQDCVPYLIAAALLKGRPFNVFGDGSSMRDYVEITDVLAAIEAACHGHESYPALNIGSGFGTTLTDLIRLLEKSLGKKTELVFKPAIRGELPVAVPDISLAMEKLHWEPRVTIEEGMARLAEWFKGPGGLLNGNGAR